MRIFRYLKWACGIGILALIVFMVMSGTAPFYLRCLHTLLLCCFMVLFRIIKGPSFADRILGIDILGTLIVGFCGILQVHTGRSWYIDIGVAWALQSFITTLAFSKYLEGKGLEE